MQVIKMLPIVIILMLLLTAFGLPLAKKKKTVFWVSLSTIFIAFVMSGMALNYVTQVGDYLLRIGPYDIPWGITFRIGYIEASWLYCLQVCRLW